MSIEVSVPLSWLLSSRRTPGRRWLYEKLSTVWGIAIACTFARYPDVRTWSSRHAARLYLYMGAFGIGIENAGMRPHPKRTDDFGKRSSTPMRREIGVFGES